MLYILLCNILFIPVIFSDSSKTINTVLNTSNQTSIVNKLHKDIPNQPKLMVSEGGSLSLDESSLSLPKNSIQPLDEKGTKKEKPVARRNGVDDPLKNMVTVSQKTPLSNIYDPADVSVKNSTNENAVATNNVKSGNSEIKTPLKNGIENATKIPHNAKINNINEPKINITGPDSSTGLNKKKIPKKKLVLSYEALANMDESQQTNIPAIKSSSKTLVNDQMPSPNADSKEVYPKNANSHPGMMPSPNADSKEVYSKNANRHPGMIMPVVISMLVLPLFAALGYMALRRGQEAWKNRHYKRMDFLIDGMYND